MRDKQSEFSSSSKERIKAKSGEEGEREGGRDIN